MKNLKRVGIGVLVLFVLLFGYDFWQSTNGWGYPGLAVLLAVFAGTGLFGKKAQNITFIVAVLAFAIALIAIGSKEGGEKWRAYQIAHPSPTPTQVVCTGIQPIPVTEPFRTSAGTVTLAIAQVGIQQIGQELVPDQEYYPKVAWTVYVYPAACQDFVEQTVKPWLTTTGVIFVLDTHQQTSQPTLTPTVP